MKNLTRYDAPGIEMISCTESGVICSSPQPGENEEIQYEDWSN